MSIPAALGWVSVMAVCVVGCLRYAMASSIVRSGTRHWLGYVVLITLSNGMLVRGNIRPAQTHQCR